MENTYNGYKIAALSAGDVGDINKLASEMNAGTSKDIVLIAYEKDL